MENICHSLDALLLRQWPTPKKQNLKNKGNYVGNLTGLLTGCGRKIKIVWEFGGKLCGKNVDCAGNCAGLRNLVTNQIINLQHSSQTRQGGNSV